MAKDPAFLMYYKQWLVSTAGWDADVRGWYINLLCHQADKPAGLPADLESLAELAGVKHSQFSRFSECFKRTLQAKFKATAEGLLQNAKLETVINDRAEFTGKQTERGIIGAFIKRARAEKGISDAQAKQLYPLLAAEKLLSKNKEEREECYKRTLIALLVNVNLIVNNIENREGPGEKGDTQLPQVQNPDQYPVHVLMKIWKDQFPNYPDDANNDAPALFGTCEFIRHQKKLPADYSDAAVRNEIATYWQQLVAHIASDSHFSGYSLQQVRKYIQSIIQSLNKPKQAEKSELQFLYERYCETGKIALKQIQESYYTQLNERGLLPPVSDHLLQSARKIRIESLPISDVTKDGQLRSAYTAQDPTADQKNLVEADKPVLVLHARRTLVRNFFNAQKAAGATDIFKPVKKAS